MPSTPVPELTQGALVELLTTSTQGVLATVKRDGRPQLSNIAYHWQPESGSAVTVAADFRAKTRNLLRDPRASLHVTSPDFALWLVGEGEAILSEPCQSRDDAIGEALIRLSGLSQGLSEDELAGHQPAYPIEGRRLIDVRVDRVYGGNATKALAISFDLPTAGVS